MDQQPPELGFSFARFAESFDLHIRQSIRGYADLMSDCVALSEFFVEDDTTVFDIGCSRGTFLLNVKNRNLRRSPRARYVGIDIERSFLSQWDAIAAEDLDLQVKDIRSAEIPDDCVFITSIFSLQFISERDRQQIIDRIFTALLPGGAFIVAEKTLSRSSKQNDMLAAIHYDFKRQSFSDEEIREKDRSLRSMMKLWSEDQIIESLTIAGFQRANIQAIWRNHSFAAFFALK